MEVELSQEGLVRTIVVGYAPRKCIRSLPYKSKPLKLKTVCVQRIVLLVPIEEVPLATRVPEEAAVSIPHHRAQPNKGEYFPLRCGHWKVKTF
jgi:hypothetical protein